MLEKKMNTEKIEEAISMLLTALGEDIDREGLVDTPKRVARMYAELMQGNNMEGTEHLSKKFEADESEYVLEKDIEYYSLCEHHLLPFFGKVHIAYIPNGSVVGISKLARTVEIFARRLQIQERMTYQIANSIQKELNPKGVMVVIEAEHLCMEMRGIKKRGTKTVTVATKGKFKEDENLRNMMLSMIRN